ncbi:VanZ family protein [Polaribacter sp. MSW13]|uniref:VanZ family protein n=1 Tax=Polaribacter marinus TaxID=2916838 RepID=A0A9X1VRC5_9FLAO|nr:VanZ family protein [Polaribacter marinus]MCI2229345.1 VanZ family protein [Polaribacter marinus]
MLKHIKTLLKGNIFLIAILITISIAYLSLMKMPQYQPTISNLDKWEHSFAYFTLSISWLFVFYKKPQKKYLIVLVCIIYGIIIEILQQTLTDYRTGDYLDVLANSSGVLLGLLIFNQILKKNQLN